MNGNRGAKGSIKDRLISLLYRYRYKKKKLKESDYTISNKETQEKYLNTLTLFKESEDINLLSSLDKQRLDDVKLTAIVKTGFSDEDDLNLENIEYGSSELDKSVNLKNEIKKTKSEIMILKEIDIFIKKSLDNLEEIQSELEILKSESKEKNKVITPTEERYKKLKLKILILKQQYDVVQNKYDLSDFKILESIKLLNNIDFYNNVASLNEAEVMVNICKKEIKKISSIVIISDKSKKVGSDIDNIKKEQKDIKIKFKKAREKTKELNDIKSLIKTELNSQKQIIDDLYNEASKFETVSKTVVSYEGFGKFISSITSIATGIVTLPLTGLSIFGHALGATMINKGLKKINNSIETKEKLVFDYEYNDISNQISNVKDKLEYTNLVIIDSLNQIKRLKENCKYFYEYDKILCENDILFSKINNLEKQLELQKIKINDMDKTLDKEENLNKQKLKKISRLKENN